MLRMQTVSDHCIRQSTSRKFTSWPNRRKFTLSSCWCWLRRSHQVPQKQKRFCVVCERAIVLWGLKLWNKPCFALNWDIVKNSASRTAFTTVCNKKLNFWLSLLCSRGRDVVAKDTIWRGISSFCCANGPDPSKRCACLPKSFRHCLCERYW